MQIKTIGWVVGTLSLLVGAGSAWAEDQPAEVTGREAINQMAGKPVCRDAGVTVSFTTGSHELDLNARGALNGVATWLKADDKRTLHLQGYADTTGNSESNLVLSEKRAEAVKDYLVSQGVDVTRIMTVGRGEEIDHLPANGRTVTFLACQAPAPIAQGETAPAPAPEAAPLVEEVAPPPPAVEPVPVEAVPPPPAHEPVYQAPAPKFGWAFMAGGGFQDFARAEMKDRTNAGGAWDLRIVGGTRSYIGFEGAYVGSAHGIQSLGVTANNPMLVSNGAEGTLRINIPVVKGHSLIEPYGFAGAGWAHYTISNYNSNTQNLSDFSRSDDVLTVPLGGGFAYGYKGFMIDVRGNYSPTYYNNLLPSTSSTGTLNTWGVGGQIGAAF